MLRIDRGDAKAAQPLLERALKIQESALGAQHPSLALTLNTLAVQRATTGDIKGALAAEERANTIAERYLALMIQTGSEDQKLAYLDTLKGLTDMAVSLHIDHAPKDPAAAELALTTILQRKGRVLDAIAGSVGALRERLAPEDRALLERLSAVRRSLAAAVLAGPGKSDPEKHRAALEPLERESARLEAAISSKSGAFRAQSKPITLKGVQAALPEGSALVELFIYQPWRPDPARPFGAPRYAAIVLQRVGPPSSVDLGEVEGIDVKVQALRAALGDPQSRDEKGLARALDELVMRPVRARLGDVRAVFLSPDGALNLIPFAALVDEQGRRLVERISFTYLTSGRDLLRLGVRSPSRQAAAIVANPTFGNTDPKDEKSGGDRSGGVFARANFTPLPGTADEAKALRTILAGASVWTGENATKASLYKLAGPKVLHIATHGFFLADPQPARAISLTSRGLELDPVSAGPSRPRLPAEKPLLLSGLALAGANASGSAKTDGILTALEAMGLDLQGTRLVVLSACETGVGAVQRGDGVYGLRRALVIAGAETQVMSLWKVDDEATRDLMVAYYNRLEAGGGRSESIAEVQRAMLASKGTAHPFFWASFIVSGDPSRLEADDAPSAVPKVSPGARGCGCEMAGEPLETGAWLWLGIGAATAMLRRRRLRS
jgi:MYXO-CTERM domain-containing protein